MDVMPCSCDLTACSCFMKNKRWRGNINCWASSQADFIQNNFLQKLMFRKQNIHKKGIFGTKTLFKAYLIHIRPYLVHFRPYLVHFQPYLMQKYHFSPLQWNFPSYFLSLSPLPPSSATRLLQFVLPGTMRFCNAATICATLYEVFQPRHGICQKFYTVGFSGKKIYTVNFT